MDEVFPGLSIVVSVVSGKILTAQKPGSGILQFQVPGDGATVHFEFINTTTGASSELDNVRLTVLDIDGCESGTTCPSGRWGPPIPGQERLTVCAPHQPTVGVKVVAQTIRGCATYTSTVGGALENNNGMAVDSLTQEQKDLSVGLKLTGLAGVDLKYEVVPHTSSSYRTMAVTGSSDLDGCDPSLTGGR